MATISQSSGVNPKLLCYMAQGGLPTETESRDFLVDLFKRDRAHVFKSKEEQERALGEITNKPKEKETLLINSSMPSNLFELLEKTNNVSDEVFPKTPPNSPLSLRRQPREPWPDESRQMEGLLNKRPLRLTIDGDENNTLEMSPEPITIDSPTSDEVNENPEETPAEAAFRRTNEEIREFNRLNPENSN